MDIEIKNMFTGEVIVAGKYASLNEKQLNVYGLKTVLKYIEWLEKELEAR